MTVGSGGCSGNLSPNYIIEPDNTTRDITLPYTDYNTYASVNAQYRNQKGYHIKNENGDIIAWTQTPNYTDSGQQQSMFTAQLTVGGTCETSYIPNSDIGDKFIMTVSPFYVINSNSNKSKIMSIEVIGKTGSSRTIQINACQDLTMIFGSGFQYSITTLLPA